MEVTMKGSAVTIKGTAKEIADLAMRLQSVQKSEKQAQQDEYEQLISPELMLRAILDNFD